MSIKLTPSGGVFGQLGGKTRESVCGVFVLCCSLSLFTIIIIVNIMATSPWNAFPPIKSSKVIEVGEKFTSIFDHDNHLVTRLQSKLLFGQTIQFVSDNDRLAEQCRQFVIDTPELQFLVVKHMPISVLIEPLFLETFHKTGQVLGFSGLL